MEQFNRVEQAVQDTLEVIENSIQETLTELHRARNSVGR